jgi:hypothetical protein
MNQRYDVIRLDAEGPMWIAAAETIEDANRRAQEFATEYCCDCMVVDQHTGAKHVVRHSG